MLSPKVSTASPSSVEHEDARAGQLSHAATARRHPQPYEILSPIGAGGMGEVYKARDTRLDRTVAIKVLPEHVASDPGLQQRFEREAKTISSLNHPHITGTMGCPKNLFDRFTAPVGIP